MLAGGCPSVKSHGWRKLTIKVSGSPLKLLEKKLARAIDNSYEELPDWDDYHIKKKHGADGENEKDEED